MAANSLWRSCRYPDGDRPNSKSSWAGLWERDPAVLINLAYDDGEKSSDEGLEKPIGSSRHQPD